jgi:outer membrane protein assembly factor BamB
MTDLDTRLRAADRIAAPDLWPDIASRRAGPAPSHDPGPGRRVAAAAVALAVAAAGGFLLVRSFGAGREAPAPQEPATHGQAGDLPAVELAVADVVDVGGPIGSVEAGDGVVFVAVSANDGSNGGRIVGIDPATGETVLEASVDTVPTWEVGGQGLAVADGVLWVGGGHDGPGGGGAVLAVDAATGQVLDRVVLGGQLVADVAVSGDGVWVLQFGSGADEPVRVVRLDPVTHEVVGTDPLTQTYARQIVAAGGGIWVHERMSRGATVTESVLTRVDPASGTVDVSVPLGGYAAGFEAVGGSLWAAASSDDVANMLQSLVRIDPVTGEVLDRHDLGPTMTVRDVFASGADGSLWFVGSGEAGFTLHRFDPGEERVDASIDLPGDLTPTALEATPSSVWVANYEGSVTRVEVGPPA